MLNLRSPYDYIKINKLPLLDPKVASKSSKGKEKIKLVKTDCQLFSNRGTASQSRAGDLDHFFAYENHAFQVSFSEYGKLRGGTKSDFLDRLKTIDKPTYIKPKIDAIIIDGQALIQMSHRKSSLKTFGSYCKVQFANKVNSFCLNANRIDIVFDVYQENSLNNYTRENMGSGEGTRTLVRHDTPIQHKKFKDFLRVEDNKIELFKMIADVAAYKCEEGILICTKDDRVLANKQFTKSNLEP